MSTFCDEIVSEVCVRESREAAQQALQEAVLEQLLLGALAKEEGDRVVEAIVLESVAAIARSVSQ